MVRIGQFDMGGETAGKIGHQDSPSPNFGTPKQAAPHQGHSNQVRISGFARIGDCLGIRCDHDSADLLAAKVDPDGDAFVWIAP